MKPIKLFAVFTFVLFFANWADAQDLLYLRNVKSPLKVKVVEVGLDEVKYKMWPASEESIVNVMEKSAISKIVLQNGDEYTFKNDENAIEPLSYEDQRKMALKFYMFSPLSDNLGFAFEKYVKKGQSWEAGLAFIGAGKDWDALYGQPTNASGLGLRFGYKFISTPDFYLKGMKRSHVLKGGYVKPEVIFVNYAINDYNYSYNSSSTYTRENGVGFALMINIGKQWIFDNAVCFDACLGLGYGSSNTDEFENRVGRNYLFLGGVSDFPLAINASFKIGGLLGKKSTNTPTK